MTDEILTEIHKIKDGIGRKYAGAPMRMMADLRKRQENSGRKIILAQVKSVASSEKRHSHLLHAR